MATNTKPLIRAEGRRTLRTLGTYEAGVTADVLAASLSITPTALRRWMRRACELSLVRVEKIPGVDRRCSTPRVRYFIAEQGKKMISRDPCARREESIADVVRRIPNSVFALGGMRHGASETS
jgi:hypothetical protein